MIAPEEWYEYQRQYQQYGIDMRPQTEREHVRRQKQQERKRKSQSMYGLTRAMENDKKVMLLLVAIAALVLIMVVVMSSYAAKLTYDINRTQVENDALIGEIEDLDVKRMSSTNITYIEEKAKKELGMKNAGAKNSVYISSDEVPETGFADILKQKAYQ